MYERFYKLSGRPFQLMPDPRLLYESRNHGRGLSYLVYGIEHREGFVVITGDVGTGKTLLLQTLLSKIGIARGAVARIAMANMNAQSVLPAVTSAFGIRYRGHAKFELMDALVARLSSNSKNGCLLIVDEAQVCTVEALEELRALSNLQANGKALLQIVLIGQSELRMLLLRPSMAHLRQRIVASYHLMPLDEDEVQAYVQHRLSRVGWVAGSPELSSDIFAKLHEWSRGIPRRINMIMDRLLLYGYLEERKDLTADQLETVIDEFDEEMKGDDLMLSMPAAEQPVAGDSSRSTRVEVLTDRIAGLERALRRQFGDNRVDELLAVYADNSERRQIIEALLRVDRLEGALTHITREEPAESPSTADDAEQMRATDSVGDPADAAEPVAHPDADLRRGADNDGIKRYFRWGRRYDT